MNVPEWTESTGMTREEWDCEVKRALYWATLEDEPADIRVGGLWCAMRDNPLPDTTGLSPEGEEAVLDRWRAQVRAWYAEREGAYRPATLPTPAVASPADRVPAP